MGRLAYGGWTWDCIRRLHQTETLSDTLSTDAALMLRWQRMSVGLANILQPNLCEWIEHKINHVADQPRGWTHRDLRPENLAFRNQRTSLIDFGQCRVDFLLLDAVPFYAGDYPPDVSRRVLEGFTRCWGSSIMVDLPLFAMLYFLGSVEQLIRPPAPAAYQRTVARYIGIRREPRSPLISMILLQRSPTCEVWKYQD